MTATGTGPGGPGAAAAWAARVRAGEVRAGARLMRALDDGEAEAAEVLAALHAHTGGAFVVGVTGPPGAGKSTLVDALVGLYRARGQRVGVVAIDPSSPFSGGAVLGDRIRMQRHALDPGVFIRSLATRGQLGGLSAAAGDVVSVLDAMGFEVVLVETVGVGQDELAIARHADTTVVVTVPGLGDEVQAMKAGLVEIGDVLVVNKADRDGADRALHDLESALALSETAGTPPAIVRTVATTGEGVPALVAAIDEHQQRQRASGAFAERRLRQTEARLRDLLADRLRARAEAALAAAGGLGQLAGEVAARRTDPYTAVTTILARI